MNGRIFSDFPALSLSAILKVALLAVPSDLSVSEDISLLFLWRIQHFAPKVLVLLKFLLAITRLIGTIFDRQFAADSANSENYDVLINNYTI